MPSVHTLATFAVAAVLFSVVPGPSVLYLIARSLSQGHRAGAVSVAGIAAGTAVQVVAMAVGLAALLATSATWFAVVKYAGAAYLIALGIRTLLSSREHDTEQPPRAQPLLAVGWQGFVVTVLNPKLALFLLALLPQFVDPSKGPAGPQIAVLGATLIIVGAVNDLCYTVFASALGRRLRRTTSVLRHSKSASGVIYIALGIFTAVTGHRPRTA
ncbi:MAG: LysE family translocator [Streptosporangiales bacterium]